MNVHVRMKKNRNIHQNLKVNCTEENVIPDIYPLHNLTISSDPLLAAVLDKNAWITIRLNKKQTDTTTQNSTMYF